LLAIVNASKTDFEVSTKPGQLQDRENQLFAQAIQIQFEAGRGMPADTVAPKQEAAEIADRRDELTSEIAKSRATLRRWTGAAGDEKR